MLKKIALLSLFVFIAAAQLDAAGVRHSRSGKIMAAELSTADVKIANLAPYHFPNLPINKAYAVISLELNDMRILSIFDYTINIAGTDFPCVALWRNGQFEYFTDNIKGTGVQQMLFIVDSKIITTEKTIDIELKNNYSGANSQYNMILPLSVIGNRLPTAPGKIPAAGLLELPEE